MENLFRSNRVYNIAAGEEENVLKMYFYARLVAPGSNAFMELEIDKTARTLTLTTKCETEDAAPFVSKYVEEFLR